MPSKDGPYRREYSRIPDSDACRQSRKKTDKLLSEERVVTDFLFWPGLLHHSSIHSEGINRFFKDLWGISYEK